VEAFILSVAKDEVPMIVVPWFLLSRLSSYTLVSVIMIRSLSTRDISER